MQYSKNWPGPHFKLKYLKEHTDGMNFENIHYKSKIIIFTYMFVFPNVYEKAVLQTNKVIFYLSKTSKLVVSLFFFGSVPKNKILPILQVKFRNNHRIHQHT